MRLFLHKYAACIHMHTYVYAQECIRMHIFIPLKICIIISLRLPKVLSMHKE